jgi:hypothetical protein
VIDEREPRSYLWRADADAPALPHFNVHRLDLQSPVNVGTQRSSG